MHVVSPQGRHLRCNKNIVLGLGVQTDVKQIERIILQSSDWPPKTRNQKSKSLEKGAARLSDHLVCLSERVLVSSILLAYWSLMARLIDQSYECSLTRSLKRPFIILQKNVTGFNPFSPKTPNFDPLMPKCVSRDCL
ncbi:hypothetical protein MTR_0028s0180 [Medicago truncatula]|uniref:Uncharacterized protein n=1 Tax=Medicago truncatula TaxID=3880 RepID=A0A072TI91_MEDTR|nr:hypothetical protein MTR_0028s0180 [Medicago truncatula]